MSENEAPAAVQADADSGPESVLPDASAVASAAVVAALARLTEGIDPDASLDEQSTTVAQRLTEAGARGVRDYMFNCPVAVYLQTATGLRVSIHGRRWYVYDADGAVITWDVTPEAVQAFVFRFDGAGAFPELDTRLAASPTAEITE